MDKKALAGKPGCSGRSNRAKAGQRSAVGKTDGPPIGGSRRLADLWRNMTGRAGCDGWFPLI